MNTELNTIPSTVTIPHFVGNGIIDWKEWKVPSPGPGELLIRNQANALCGSDRPQFFTGSAVTPGHEAAGVVAARGEGTQTAVGTPGVVFLMDFCGECRSCRMGFTNQCLAKRADMGFNRHGGYNPYMIINENIFFPVDAGLEMGDATMLLDIMGTGGHAIKRAQLIHQDIESVLVGGAGPIGLGILAMVKLLLGKDIPVFVTDFIDYRLKLAESMGGIAINLNSSTIDSALGQHGLKGVDVSLDTTGKQVARQAELNALSQRGVLVCVGHGEGLDLTISSDIIAPERTVIGSEYFQYAELHENAALLREHLSYMQAIITHRFPLKDIQHAYELFFKGESGKVIIEQ